MSASASISRQGILGRIFMRLFPPRDPTARSLYDAMVLIDKMISNLESSKRGLQAALDEHAKRAKMAAQEGKNEYKMIFDEEMKHISSLITIFDKVTFDLLRVKYRLETLTLVEEPMKMLPEVIQELQNLRPEVEKIAPELTAMLSEVERKVASIMVASNLLPATPGPASARLPEPASKRQLPLPPPPPSNVPEVPEAKKQEIAVESRIAVGTNVIAQWLIDEIKRRGGVIDVSMFAAKYKVDKEKVYEALRRLEERGLIKVKRY